MAKQVGAEDKTIAAKRSGLLDGSRAMRHAFRAVRPGFLALGAHLSRPLATCEPKEQSLEQFLKSSKAQKWIELNSDKTKSCASSLAFKIPLNYIHVIKIS